jgi:hypothetical protein
MKINKTNVLTACLMSFGAMSAAYASPEIESNNSIASAQALPASGSHSINGVIGVLGGSTSDDLDYYSFQASAGDVLNIDIDNGYGGAGNVNTIIAIFDTSGTLLRMNDNATSLDTGSSSVLDSRIDAFVVPASGTYTVGVSAFPQFFNLDGTVPVTSSSTSTISVGPGPGPAPAPGGMIASFTPAGDYTLNIDGISSRVKQINIEIKPGSSELAPLNPRSQGKIPVAIMGAVGFDVHQVKQTTLSFGSSGNEKSLSKCQPQAKDINKDGYADLLCHFENSASGFRSGDIEGIVKGELNGGARFEGHAVLKVVPSRRK